jgi:hypothetical protein
MRLLNEINYRDYKNPELFFKNFPKDCHLTILQGKLHSIVTSLADNVFCLLQNYCSNKSYRIKRNFICSVNISRNT